MRRTFFLSILIAATIIGCAAHLPSSGPTAGEARGLYFTGFEATHFRPCEETAGIGARVAFDSAAVAELPARWPAGGRSTSHGWTYEVYYVRWVLRELSEATPPPGMIRISNAPRRAVTRVLELRAPKADECGWRDRELPPLRPNVR